MSRAQQQIQCLLMQVHIHIWHHHEKPFFGKLVCLELVVGRMDSRPIGEEKQQLRRRMRVVTRLRDIHLRRIRSTALLAIDLDEEAHTSMSPSLEISCITSVVAEACLEMEIIRQSMLLRCLMGDISPSSGGKLSMTHLVVYP